MTLAFLAFSVVVSAELTVDSSATGLLLLLKSSLCFPFPVAVSAEFDDDVDGIANSCRIAWKKKNREINFSVIDYIDLDYYICMGENCEIYDVSIPICMVCHLEKK